MPKILLAECKQEVSSFNPVVSHYGDFSVLEGGDMLAFHRNRRLETGGAVSVFGEHPDVELVPTYSARARTSDTSGGMSERYPSRLSVPMGELD